jgi:indole-3-glycerol phosphate synthase
VNRAFSHAISHGEGISLIPVVDDADGARRAEADGVGAVLARGDVAAIRAATALPILGYVAGADACIVEAGEDVELAEEVELVVRVEREEQLDEVLERLDPELFVLAADDEEDPLEHVLSLLSGVPAGKLAIVELAQLTRDQIDELERAGVDAVLVREPLPAA